MIRRRNGEPTGSGNSQHPSAGAEGFGPDAALMGFHGTATCTSAYASPARTSDDGFSAVSGGPLHLAHGRGRGHGTSTNNGIGSAHQPNKLYVSSPSPAPGVGLGGSGYRGGPTPVVEDLGDRTPLFGSPPGSAAGFDARFARHGSGGGGSSVSALHSARSRDRRRFMGRLAVRATQPAALMMLAGLALVMMLSTSWSGSGSGGIAASAPTATMSTSGRKVLAATAAASGGAAELLAETAVDVLSQAAALGSTADGTGSHGSIKVVQPENLRSAAAASAPNGSAQGTAAAAPTAAAQATPLSATAGATTANVDSPAKGDAGVLWLLDKDGNKKVILIPRDSEKKQATAAAAAAAGTSTGGSTQVASKLQQKQSLLQKLGLARKKDHKKQKQPQQQQKQQAAETIPAAASTATTTDPSAASNVVTYYYDSVIPQTTMTSTGGAASTGTGPGQEAPLAATSTSVAVPEVVYNKMGNAVKLVDLHNVGATEKTSGISNPVLASPADDVINAVADALPSNANAAAKVPKTSPATQAAAGATATKTMASIGSAAASTLAGASSIEAEGTTNQLIVIATVATMALFGGALLARRMRTRNFLNSCIENESLEDELAYDAANTTLGAAVGYDTFSAVGDMKWKGDLEKFDV